MSVINSKNAQSQKTYSLDGKLLEEVNPLKDTIQYKYNPVGELTVYPRGRFEEKNRAFEEIG